jgi:hypothetical protein
MSLLIVSFLLSVFGGIWSLWGIIQSKYTASILGFMACVFSIIALFLHSYDCYSSTLSSDLNTTALKITLCTSQLSSAYLFAYVMLVLSGIMAIYAIWRLAIRGE